MATTDTLPGSPLTRRAFLLTSLGALVALVAGRRWSEASHRATNQDAVRPRRADNLREEAYGTGLALRPTPVDPRGPVFRLNEPAALIWRNIDGRRTIDDLAALLVGRYGVAQARARADTRACIQAFSGAGLAFGLDG